MTDAWGVLQNMANRAVLDRIKVSARGNRSEPTVLTGDLPDAASLWKACVSEDGDSGPVPGTMAHGVGATLGSHGFMTAITGWHVIRMLRQMKEEDEVSDAFSYLMRKELPATPRDVIVNTKALMEEGEFTDRDVRRMLRVLGFESGIRKGQAEDREDAPNAQDPVDLTEDSVNQEDQACPDEGSPAADPQDDQAGPPEDAANSSASASRLNTGVQPGPYQAQPGVQPDPATPARKRKRGSDPRPVGTPPPRRIPSGPFRGRGPGRRPGAIGYGMTPSRHPC